MSKNQHTFAKRQREIEKKRKADEKRARRVTKGQTADPDEDQDQDHGVQPPTDIAQ